MQDYTPQAIIQASPEIHKTLQAVTVNLLLLRDRIIFTSPPTQEIWEATAPHLINATSPTWILPWIVLDFDFRPDAETPVKYAGPQFFMRGSLEWSVDLQGNLLKDGKPLTPIEKLRYHKLEHPLSDISKFNVLTTLAQKEALGEHLLGLSAKSLIPRVLATSQDKHWGHSADILDSAVKTFRDASATQVLTLPPGWDAQWVSPDPQILTQIMSFTLSAKKGIAELIQGSRLMTDLGSVGSQAAVREFRRQELSYHMSRLQILTQFFLTLLDAKGASQGLFFDPHFTLYNILESELESL